MSTEDREVSKTELAIALAQGVSVKVWAAKHNVPQRTVYRWTKEPEVRKEVTAFRRRMIDRAVGLMVKRSYRSVKGINALADSAESESVRLRAHQTILSQMVAVSHFGALDDRLTDMEERLDARDRDAGRAN
jgi:hypothetical protein